MSTIDPLVPGRTRLRITRRGRRMLLGLASIPLASAIVFSALSGGMASASAERVSVDVPASTIVVMPGDTLWSLATQIAPDVDPRRVIDEIAQVNGLRSSGLMVGQQLILPAAYGNNS